LAWVSTHIECFLAQPVFELYRWSGYIVYHSEKCQD